MKREMEAQAAAEKELAKAEAKVIADAAKAEAAQIAADEAAEAARVFDKNRPDARIIFMESEMPDYELEVRGSIYHLTEKKTGLVSLLTETEIDALNNAVDAWQQQERDRVMAIFNKIVSRKSK